MDDRVSGWTGFERLHQHEDKVLLVLTLIIGAVVGLVVSAFIYLTETLGSRMYPAGGAAWRRLVIPVVGALITGYPLARYFPEARGSGIPQTKVALYLRDGFISLRTVLGKFFCSSVSLASGIALGREGPSVQVGAGLASVFGRRLGLSTDRIRALVPIGSAAALAAAFNTPVAAVLFSLEEVIGDLHAPVLGSIVLSSATSWIVLHLLLGDEPLFHVPPYQLVSPFEFFFYAALGIIGGLVSVCFVKLLLFIRKRFLALPKRTEWIQPAAGGLAVGLMGWFVPDVLGVGYGHVSEALNGQMALKLMILLVALKLIATASCYGTGNAGGIFGPTLFLGAMMGGATGGAVHYFFPDSTGSVGAYALVGMGVAFAGIVRVPLTSVIMVFEMTRDYSIIVPLMISNLLSFVISYRLQEDPIYEALQQQDGLHLPSQLRQRQGMPLVKLAVVPAERIFPRDTTLAEASAALAAAGHRQNAWPVTGPDGLLGMVSLAGIQKELAQGRGAKTLAEILPAGGGREGLRAENFPHVHPDHPLDVALRRMAQSKLHVLPVVSRSNVRQLLGVVSIDDVLRAYGLTGSQPETEPSRLAAPRRSGAGFLSGLIAATLAVLVLAGFLNYYYGSRRRSRAEASFQSGNELLLHGQDQAAIEEFRNALSTSRDNLDYRLALGLALIKTGQLGEAAVYLQELLRRDPNNGRANLGLARVAARQGNTEDAVTLYHRAIYGSWPASQQPERLEARFELAAFLKKKGLATQAMAELLAARDRARNKPPEEKRIARLLLDYGSPRQSAGVFEEVLAANNQDAEAYAGLGAALLAQGDYASARKAFLSALRLNPGDDASTRELDLCNRALELDPTARGLNAAERYRRSQLLLKGALDDFESCASTVEISNGSPPARSAEVARQALARRPRPGSYDEASESDLSLAVALRAARRKLCPAMPVAGQASDRVLQHISP